MNHDRKKNICFLLGSINGIGGTGRAVSILVNELQKTKKYNISVLCYYQKDKYSGYPINDDIEINTILKKPMNMRKGILSVVTYLLKYLRKRKIDTIIACGVLQFPAAIVAARAMKCQVICSDHSNYTSVSDVKYERQARNFAARFSDVLITLTEKDIENYKSNTKVNAKIDFIHNIVDNKLLDNNSTYQIHSKKIISVGRLTYAKNYELLIEIAAEILPKYPDWCWDIYGSGELNDNLQEKITEMQVERLTLKGAVSNIYELYQEYAFLVMTSRYEGYPMVLLESIANKVPAIAFDCQTGPSDIINHNQTGLLIEENNITQMINSIEQMILNSSNRIRMSQNCESAMGEFSTTDIINKWSFYL